jgi:plasmid stabilization system protein ParE
VKVEFSAEAEAQVLHIDGWWRRQRRSSPDLFEGELEATLERVLFSPKLGTVYEQRDIDETVYRVLMPRTRHHVYYVLRGEVLFVLSVWGATKGRGPTL